MNELSKEKSLSTADLAGARRSQPQRRPEASSRPEDRPEEPEAKAAQPGESGTSREVPIGREAPDVLAEQRAPEIPGHPETPSPVFSRDEAQRLQAEWDAVQIAFVDEPRRSVEGADELVARTIQRLAEVFARERAGLEEQWGRGDEVSTEDLRVALRRYRSFFGRLLSV
jgi:hypothetical protein